MNIAERIQHLRKAKGISQEQLADKIGVSRQAVSKWESEQSLPDIEKVILLCEFFDVTTDYLLRGVDVQPNIPEKEMDARLFAAIATAINFIGLIVAILIWIEERRPVSVAVGLSLLAIGCLIFAIGQLLGKNKKIAGRHFLFINVWLLCLIPISCIFNCIQGFFGGFCWLLSPLPQFGNSYAAYFSGWLIYIAFCILVDAYIIVKDKKQEAP